MAKMNGHILLTSLQIKKLSKGEELRIAREGKIVLIGLKKRHEEKVKLLTQIKELRDKVRKLERKGTDGTESLKK